MDKFILAEKLFEGNDLDGSLQLLNECAQESQVDKQVFVLRARVRFKQQNWGGAMNDFMSVLEVDPENREAKTGLAMTQNILGYFNPDLYNP